MTKLEAAVARVLEDSEMVDGDIWGYIVSVSAMDALRAAMEQED